MDFIKRLIKLALEYQDDLDAEAPVGAPSPPPPEPPGDTPACRGESTPVAPSAPATHPTNSSATEAEAMPVDRHETEAAAIPEVGQPTPQPEAEASATEPSAPSRENEVAAPVADHLDIQGLPDIAEPMPLEPEMYQDIRQANLPDDCSDTTFINLPPRRPSFFDK